ncbi:hypothetical protein Taro_005848, partial [Colocasia esculenta]|nr:hypothetical protein [Colocasia esculenta]
ALQGRGSARFVGGGSWIVGARRWRVTSLREGPLRLDLHLEVRLHSSSLRGIARRWARRRGSARFVGGGSWIVGARRWRVASLREGPLRLDLHLEISNITNASAMGPDLVLGRAPESAICPWELNDQDVGITSKCHTI